MKKPGIYFLALIISVLSADAQGQVQADKEGLFARFITNKGTIVVRLEYKKTPMTVANFVGLAEGTVSNATYPKGEPFFNGSVWHRVVKGHVIQGGSPANSDPLNDEKSPTGYVIPNEITDLSHNRAGILGMANAGPHTNTCQYYITLADRSYLDGNYTVFGEVTEGMEVVNNIVQGDTTLRIVIERKGKEAKRFKSDDESFRVLVDNQWKKVKEQEELKKTADEKYISDNYPGLSSDPSGLRYRVLKEGIGPVPVKGTVLEISYKGRLTNGISFAAIAEDGRPVAGADPAVFRYELGSGKLVRGLESSLSVMKQGETRQVVVPPELAFGTNGFYGRYISGNKRFVINPGEILLIELTLVSFK